MVSETEYQAICKALSVNFDRFVEYTQAELSGKAFTVQEEEYKTLRTQYNYLTELASTIKNASL